MDLKTNRVKKTSRLDYFSSRQRANVNPGMSQINLVWPEQKFLVFVLVVTALIGAVQSGDSRSFETCVGSQTKHHRQPHRRFQTTFQTDRCLESPPIRTGYSSDVFVHHCNAARLGLVFSDRSSLAQLHQHPCAA